MKYNQVESATLRTHHAKSCATLKKTNVYRDAGMPQVRHRNTRVLLRHRSRHRLRPLSQLRQGVLPQNPGTRHLTRQNSAIPS